MSEQSGDVRALIEQIAKSLVDEPDQVSVSQLEGDVLELKVAPNDVGKVIGKQGPRGARVAGADWRGGNSIAQAFHAGDSGIAVRNHRRVHHPGPRAENAGTPWRSRSRVAQRRS